MHTTGAPGLLMWDRPDIIVEGTRRLAKAIRSVDKRMHVSEPPGIALLEQVVVESGEMAPAEVSGTTIGVDGGSAAEAARRGSLGKGTPTQGVDRRESLTQFSVDPSGHLQPVST